MALWPLAIFKITHVVSNLVAYLVCFVSSNKLRQLLLAQLL